MDKLFYRMVSFVTSVHRIQHILGRGIDLRGLTPLQYGILEYIAVDQPVTLSGIRDCMGLSMPNASRELKKLTEMGLCLKTTDEVDRRKQHVTLSPEGEAGMGAIFAQMEQKMLEGLAQTSEEELNEIVAAMDTLQRLVFDEKKWQNPS